MLCWYYYSHITVWIYFYYLIFIIFNVRNNRIFFVPLAVFIAIMGRLCPKKIKIWKQKWNFPAHRGTVKALPNKGRLLPGFVQVTAIFRLAHCKENWCWHNHPFPYYSQTSMTKLCPPYWKAKAYSLIQYSKFRGILGTTCTVIIVTFIYSSNVQMVL